jgi:hypothetical protein
MKKILLTVCAALAGCAAEPVPYHSGNEIPRGPGLLSGSQGEFVLSAQDWREYQEWREQRRQGAGAQSQ